MTNIDSYHVYNVLPLLVSSLPLSRSIRRVRIIVITQHGKRIPRLRQCDICHIIYKMIYGHTGIKVPQFARSQSVLVQKY